MPEPMTAIFMGTNGVTRNVCHTAQGDRWMHHHRRGGSSCRSAASARRSGEPQAAVALSPGREGQGALLLLRELFDRRPDRVAQLGLGRRNGVDAIGLERVAVGRDRREQERHQGDLVVFRDQMKRTEEHTSETKSLMRISYAVSCMKKTTKDPTTSNINS